MRLRSLHGRAGGDARAFDGGAPATRGGSRGKPDEIVEPREAWLGGRGRMRGRRTVIVADGGGDGVVCADLLYRRRLQPRDTQAVADSGAPREPWLCTCGR